jgi:type II secretory ATPase GspE/PulE/Tfp pilus assembly ATPase PilB-like protein
MSEPIRKLIMQGASAAELKTAAESEGMINMRRDGMLKTRDGVTTVSEVLRNVFTIL